MNPEELVRDLAEDGTRFDLNPTRRHLGCTSDCDEFYCEYIKRIDAGIRERARDALAGKGEDPMREALAELFSWVQNWDPNFIHDEEWPDTRSKVEAALKQGTDGE